MTLDARRPAQAIFAIFLLALAAEEPRAELLLSGDVALRNDIQLLADAGIIDAPITGWPIFLTGITLNSDAIAMLDPATAAALERVFPSREPHTLPRLDFRLGGINEPERLRGFANVPRASGEASARFAWEGGRFALDVSATRVSDPVDGDKNRLDGSYIGVAIGNWFVSASTTDRWWGPGWDGSMILSNNARPIPAISVQRREARPTSIRWLRWVGPWTTQLIMGQMESDRHIPDTRFFGWRVGFKPLPRLEVGLSRTAQWCGEGRPCGFDTFIDLLSGIRDNQGQNVSSDEEPGNQLAGFDLRYSFDLFDHPLAFYTQWIGEDEQNGVPSGYLAQLGFETWGSIRNNGSSYRVHVEYNEPTCSAITDEDPNFGCAYNHFRYRDGYRYKGRVIGHSADSDGKIVSFGGMLFTADGHSWQVVARHGELNRDSRARHSLTPLKQDISTLELRHVRKFDFGDLVLGIGAESAEVVSTGEQLDETRAYAEFIYKLGGQ
ncbi:MAG: capsule assembly Wzi family protein [Gammaproteobacteria bacterium]